MATPDESRVASGLSTGRRHRLWQSAAWARARGWWGGLLACALAAVGQATLLAGGPGAGWWYVVGIILLLAVLLGPAGRWASRTRGGETTPPDGLAGAATGGGKEGGAPAASSPEVRVLAAEDTVAEPTPANAGERHGAARTGAHGRSTGRTRTAATLLMGQGRRLRGRLSRVSKGARVTGAGLALSMVLAAGATIVLEGDIGSPLGGWLWAAALGVFTLTCARARPWSGARELLPRPESDAFAPGLPRLPPGWEALLIGGILLLALLLRLVNIETMPGIFGDEGERGVAARAIVEGQPTPLFGYGWYGVPNFYFYALAWSLRFFGDSMVGARMLSVLSGVLAVWIIYRIARLGWGPRAGLIAATLLSVSPLALQFSRTATESTPTGTLWAGGFLFLLRGLRGRRPVDWVVSGLLCGLSLYFYASAKLIVPLLGAVTLYCLVRWRRAFWTCCAPGFLLLGLAFALVFLPAAVLNMKDHWQAFFGRAQETSIFSASNQPQVFAQYGVPYDPAWAAQPVLKTMLSHPWSWARVIVAQLRVTVEVLYRHGDATLFYQIHHHGGSMLSPLLAALTLLGLFYAVCLLWDARFGLTSLWFWGGMMGAALTIDTPSVQRLAGAWPVIMVFPAVVLDRIWAAAWPLSPRLARRWATLPLAALLVYFGVEGYQEYFGHYASTCPYCDSTAQARYAQGLGQRFKIYQLGVGTSDVFFSYGSTRFVAKGVEGVDLAVPADFLPITDNHGKGAAFLIYSWNADYLSLIRLFYPGGQEKAVTSADGVVRFTTYTLTAAQLAGFQTLHASYASRTGRVLTRAEPNLGTARSPSVSTGPWRSPAGLPYPLRATWRGGLVAPAYGSYTFVLTGSDATLEIDGRAVLSPATRPHGAGATSVVTLLLARGLHDVLLNGNLAGPTTPLAVSWTPPGGSAGPIGAAYLYQGPGGTGGLSGAIWPYVPATPLPATRLVAGTPPLLRRSDPFFGFREATPDFGQSPFVGLWQGTLDAPVGGTYSLETVSSGPTALLVDGRPLLYRPAGGDVSSTSAPLTLRRGRHKVALWYAWQGGPARLEWYWTPPGGRRALVPPTVLIPGPRSWPQATVAAPPGTDAAPGTGVVLPAQIVGTGVGLHEPRGIGVDSRGQIYIGDSGNRRVVLLAPSGQPLGDWSGATPSAAPGAFGLLADVAVAPDGRVAILDVTTGDVQVFSPAGRVVLHLPHVAPSSSGLAFDPSGRLWVAATAKDAVLRYTATGRLESVLLGGAVGSAARFDQPVDVALDSDGTAYVVDLRARIIKLDRAGTVAAQWPVPIGLTRGGSHLAVWRHRVVMTDPDRQRLVVLDPATGRLSFIGMAGTAPGQFRLPIGVAVGPGDKLYVVDSDNARVQVFSRP